MSIQPQIRCETTITRGYVAQWLGWISCDQSRLRIQYAYGVGVEPLSASGVAVWNKSAIVAGTLLDAVLMNGDEGLVLVAHYGRWSFRSPVRAENDAEEVLRILQTLRGESD